ncbi:MAG TPA: DUF3459 domain-containing protein, partial [Kofleriaceae bacterium]|nr:DUF3459 domain-containing protein [Kofleriaceae bacterium]
GVVPADRFADPLAAAEPGQTRDAARTPMPWQPGVGLGFTTGRPWLPDGERRPGDTASAQRSDPRSHLAAVQRLLATRRHLLASAALDHDHAAVPHPHRGVARFRRGAVEVIVNLADAPAPLQLDAPAVFDSDDAGVTPSAPRAADPIALAPQQAIVLLHGQP